MPKQGASGKVKTSAARRAGKKAVGDSFYIIESTGALS